ncbi:hypothetical protein VCHA54P500_10252 [Vibrio chagasii]|nr:hypothetical protein VCHA34P117_10127 [Vibrio chagasii]CAH7025329.1 hypothetical protein VCHA40O236_10127 [Vibrio chagasii]CAH7028393.1 hypothetical protein VCHA48P439_10252 [Vibrio chagasii]CAH7092989.1 hypothetical protein VCHA54P500_10252 [Vibrio chagasii]CAH7277929.1 hypothetical protein VCHA53O462_10252 [Vibrio chagasii]
MALRNEVVKRAIYSPAAGIKYTNADQIDTQPTTATASNQSFLSMHISTRRRPAEIKHKQCQFYK